MIGRRGFITGRANFDVVTMDTYSADMAELSSMAAGIGQQQQQEIKSLHRMIWMLVQAGGGAVRIPHHVQAEYDRATAMLTVENMAHDMSIVVRTR